MLSDFGLILYFKKTQFDNLSLIKPNLNINAPFHTRGVHVTRSHF